MRQVNQLQRILFKSTLVLFSFGSALSIQAKAPSIDSPSVAEQYLLSAANQERTSRGLHKLNRDPILTKAAAFHALQMAEHGDISHEFPGEPDLSVRGANAGVHFSLISENVAEAPDSVVIHDMWMHSDGHRANLLDPNVNVVGISVIARNEQLYAVEDFASTVESLTLSEQESTVTTLLLRSGVTISTNSGVTIDDARQTCTMHTNHVGMRKPWFIMRYTASTLAELPAELKTRLNSGKYHQAAVGACSASDSSPFTAYNIAVLLYP
jgi:uncharacterized protein YkwD